MSDSTDKALDDLNAFTQAFTAVMTGMSLPSQKLTELMGAEEHQGIINKIVSLYNNGTIDLSEIENDADAANVLLQQFNTLGNYDLGNLRAFIAAAHDEGVDLLDILLEIERKGSPTAGINRVAEAYKALRTSMAKHTSGDLSDDDYLEELEAQLDHIDEMIDKDREHADGWNTIKNYIISTRAELEAYLDTTLDATKEIESSVGGISDAFAEQAENGKLSAETILSVVEAGYAAALEIDEETKAVKLNADAYIMLAGAKIQEQIASLTISRDALVNKANKEAEALDNVTASVQELTVWKMALSAANSTAINDYNAQIAALQNLFDNLSVITAGEYGGGGGSSDPWKDAAEKEFAALEHLYNMDLITIQEYHERYNALNQKYYAGREKYIDDYRANLEELKSLQEEIYELEIEDIQAKIDYNDARDWEAPEQIQDPVSGVMRDTTELDYVQDMMRLLEQYYNDGKISYKYYTDKKKELEAKIAALQAELAALESTEV